MLVGFQILKLVTGPGKPTLHHTHTPQSQLSAADTNGAVDTLCHHHSKKMADACNVIMNKVRGALATAEAELVDEGIGKKKVQIALEEVRSLLRPISFRHFERPEEFNIGYNSPTLCLQRQSSI